MGETAGPLLKDQRGLVLVLTLNRPEVRNALNGELITSLSDALRSAAEDDGVRAVVITGAGEKTFCAGMDLRAFTEVMSSGGDAAVFDALTWFHHGGFPKPVIAALNGDALAGGLELAMACDLVVAADHARFGLPEVKRGLFAAGGGTMLSARIPLAIALELGLTGDPIDAARAHAVGLINRVVSRDQVLDVALEIASKVAANGPLGVQATKRLMRDAALVEPERGWPDEASTRRVFESEDAIEGATAFVEKREPRWKGR